jgi:hypothetical protein
MIVENYTPHDLTFVDQDGNEVAVLPPSGNVARIATEPAPAQDTTVKVGDVEIPVKAARYGRLEGLPPRREGVLLVVPLLTALAAPADRDDLVVPHDQVRNARGTVVGCRALGRAVR